ncbi:glycosyltransferase 2-like domain-containing protein [Pseudoscourfieldia marina]
MHVNDTIWIAMHAYNDSLALKKAIDSVESQQPSFSRVRIVVFEDLSMDMLSREEGSLFKHVHFLEQPVERMGSAFAKWKMFSWIRRHAAPHDFILILDGDDVLADHNILQDVRNELIQHKPWFAWGKYRGKYAEQCGPLRGSSGNVRKSVWSFCHPRIFRAFMLHLLSEQMFQRRDGAWLQKATDRPLIYSFIEVAGNNRILYLGYMRPLYNYTFGSSSGVNIFRREVILGDRQLTQQQKAWPARRDLIYVIACVFNRRNTGAWLERIHASVLNTNQNARIHICNNSPERQAEFEAIADRLNMDSSINTKIHNMGQNTFGFGRFLLARSLREIEMIDYIIMIDDDQFVRAHTIQQVWRERQPQTYKCWYGRNWNRGVTSYWSNVFESEWNAVSDDPDKMMSTHPEIKTWRYGGTGMSVVDASVFSCDDLFALKDPYTRAEDIWLSFVVQSLGWKISRLFVSFDIARRESQSGQWRRLIDVKNTLFRMTRFLRPC